MTVDFSQLVIFFSLYSFYGWICETVYCSVLDGRLAHRGFLRGPYCPIYGVGALLVLGCCLPLSQQPILVFGLSMLLASLLEYFTGWLFETFLQMRLWDYSHNRFNLQGRVCLLNSTLFGLLGLAAVYLLHPLTRKLVFMLDPVRQKAAASVLLVIFVLDFLGSLKAASGLTEQLGQLRLRLDELRPGSAAEAWLADNGPSANFRKLRRRLEERGLGQPGGPRFEFLKARTGPKDAAWRLVRNYPNLSPKNLKEELSILRECWNSDRVSSSRNWRELVSGGSGK